MRQTITITDNQNFTKNGQNCQKISLEILTEGLSGKTDTNQAEIGNGEDGCSSLTMKITDFHSMDGHAAAHPVGLAAGCTFTMKITDFHSMDGHAAAHPVGLAAGCTFTINITYAPPVMEEHNTVTATLDDGSDRQASCTLSQENDQEYRADWFSHIETVASDAPMEYSDSHFSVCDTLDKLIANDRAFQILADALYSMNGTKLKKSMAASMGDKTPLELVSTLDSADSLGTPGDGKKIPENAMQIINAELNKIPKLTL